MFRLPCARKSEYDPCRTSAVVSLTMAIFLFTPYQVHGQASLSILRGIENEVVSLVKQVEPSVVSITTQQRMMMMDGRSLWGHSVGSGVVIQSDGYILTTINVVNGKDRIQVGFSDGQQRDGILVGTDRLSGIAVVRVDSITALPAVLGDSDDIHRGSWAIMMGNAYGLPSSVSIGLVNGTRSEDGLMQISAMANPGSTGGAVFSTDGRVIGLIAAELTHSAQGLVASEDGMAIEGLNMLPHPDGAVLVIPINHVKMFAEQLIKHGEIRRSWLGVEVEQTWYSIDVSDNMIGVIESPQGLRITSVTLGSPAAAAGLLPGDRIIAVNNNPMNHHIRLAEYVTTLPVGSRIEIRYRRSDAVTLTQAVLADPPMHETGLTEPGLLARLPDDPVPVGEEQLMNDRTIQWLMDLDHRLRMFEQQFRNAQKQENSSQTRP